MLFRDAEWCNLEAHEIDRMVARHFSHGRACELV
jgi:hypothetical protein